MSTFIVTFLDPETAAMHKVGVLAGCSHGMQEFLDEEVAPKVGSKTPVVIVDVKKVSFDESCKLSLKSHSL